MIETWREHLEVHRSRIDDDPLANPIKLLSREILQAMQDGTIDSGGIEALVQQLSMTAFDERAQRVRRYMGEVDPQANLLKVAELVRQRAMAGDEPLPFAEFRTLVERCHFGIVFTAHPTFSLAQALQQDLVTLALQRNIDGDPLAAEERAEVVARASLARHRPEPQLDLDEEHRQSLHAIGNIRTALADMYRVIGDVARELYPDMWITLCPSLVNVATWVGYDTDGRSDIGWSVTLSKRIRTQLDQLGYYRDRIAGLRRSAPPSAVLEANLELIDARLALSEKALTDELAVLEAFDAREPSTVGEIATISREMVADRSRLADSRQLAGLVERTMDLAEDADTRRELWVLRAEIANQGLTAARTHVRINSVQLHNAVRKSIGMDHPADDPGHRASYLEAVEELIRNVEPVSINFGSVMHEKATAKRVFMLIRQMLRHYDASEPVRFLIAECETPLTLLTALYYARLFGVDERVDISPLFETAKALDRGIDLIRGTLEVEAYRDYLRKRGRICIQTGFSDAGRYMGQIAASHAVERIRIALHDLLVETGLENLEVVIFDTHGESIGRGAHPGCLSERFRYYGTSHSRKLFTDAGIHMLQETSFQGGDGYTYFLRTESSLAVLTRILEHCFGDCDEGPDPFYDLTHRTEEFFAAIKQYNSQVIDDPCYAAFLGAYGVNMLYPTGSRALKRQHDRGVGAADLEHPSQLRAIPHNSILQQLGILANTIGGVGQAVDKDPDWFHRLYRESPRFRRLMNMVEHAFMFTDLDVVKAYIDLFDPEAWLRRAQLEKDDQHEEELSRVADFLEQMRQHYRLARIFRTFHKDYNGLARALRDHRRMTRDAGDEPIAIAPAIRDNLHMLHALRLAIIQMLMLRAVHVPDFSDRHATTHDELVAGLLRLDVEPALALLGEVFPLTETDQKLHFGEQASYQGDDTQSYGHEHQKIFTPIARYHDLIRRISSGIIHHLGAIG
ncbi:MAG: phosphoenolpyruvate carboxylase [Geminicoccaceae bacterium]|nr:phosphoenolpyruvate carboxylase [Geminicoccaceae bacterium]